MKGKMKFGNGLLPINRFEQFKIILKEHFFDVLICSIYTFLFFIPTLLWSLFSSSFALFQEQSIFNILVIYVGFILTIVIQGLGYAGGFYYFKRLIHNEGSNVHIDFFKGIQKNGKSFAFIFMLIGFGYFLLHLVSESLLILDSLPINPAIFIGVEYAILFIILTVILFVMTQAIFYTGTWRQFFKNGFKFMIGTIFKTLGVSIMFLLPFILFEFIGNFTLTLIILIGCLVFYFGISELVVLIYMVDIYDKTINKKQFPEIYRKGIQKDEAMDI